MILKPYPSYEDSGVEWLGRIPAHWKSARIKNLFNIVNGSTPSSSEPSFWDGDIVWITPDDLGKTQELRIGDSARKITNEGYESCGTRLVPEGSIIISTRAPIGYVAIAAIGLCTNQGCKSLVPIRPLSDAFFYYQLISTKAELEARGAGSTFMELSKDKLGSIIVATPPDSEQRGIASFLDRETAKIDALIEKKERLIELLQEKRTAFITQAVTKGLDPTVPMKDSGIEWLGRIPAHWEVKRIKNVARLHTGGTPAGLLDEAFEEAGIPWIKPEQLQGDCGVAAPDRRLSRSAAKSLGKVIAGSSLICGIGTVGKTGYAPFDVCTNQQINAITFSQEVTSRYSQFMVVCLEQEFVRCANKVTIAICNKSQMGEVFVCIPQAEEQRSIESFLDRETAKIDVLMSRIHEAVIRLKEYRVALVSAAVTGKIDVTREGMLGNNPE